LRISPLDVRSQEFKKSFRGFDPEEVKAFLDAIADTMEDLLKEKETAESELIALRKKVETFTEMEISLRDAMVAAQKAADEAKMNARRNAELMIREADLEVRQRIAEAKRKVDDVFKARETVRAEMRAFLPRLRSLLESQLTYLENIEQEVSGMELGNGATGTEARELRSVTETVEARAKEAETAARDEAARQLEEAIERREQVAGERAIQAEERHEPNPLDEAMQQHHEKKAEGRGEPAGEAGHQEPPQHEAGEAGHQEPPQHEAAPPATGQDTTWKPASTEEAPASNEELHISHAPHEGSESDKREDVNA